MRKPIMSNLLFGYEGYDSKDEHNENEYDSSDSNISKEFSKNECSVDMNQSIREKKAELVHELRYGDGKERVDAASRLIEMLDTDVKNETTWQLIKELTALLVEDWAIDELKRVTKNIEKNNRHKKNWGEMQAYLVGKMSYEIFKRLEKEQSDREILIIGELLKRSGLLLIKLVTKPVNWIYEQISSLFNKNKENKPDAKEIINQIKEDPKQAWARIMKMNLDDTLTLFEQVDSIFSEEGINIPEPVQDRDEVIAELSSKISELCASAPQHVKEKIDVASLTEKLDTIA